MKRTRSGIQHGKHSNHVSGQVLWVYGMHEDQRERGLTIGGYDAAWLADIVAGYILELARDHFANTKFVGMYWDDGKVIFNGVYSVRELQNWLLHDFQTTVNEITGDRSIQFTMDVWKAGSETYVANEEKTLKINGDSAKFPYLDMQMAWNKPGIIKNPAERKSIFWARQNHFLRYKEFLIKRKRYPELLYAKASSNRCTKATNTRSSPTNKVHLQVAHFI